MRFAFPLVLDPVAPSIQRALYDALRAAILEGRLSSGARLPSSRALGSELGLARGTVVAAYEQLAGEGYVVTRAGSGTVVAADLPDRWFAAPAARKPGPLPSARRIVRVPPTPFPVRAGKTPRPFRAHVPAVDVFPIELWGRLVARRARRDEGLFLDDSDVRGYLPLREVLAEHLRVARGVVCDADHVVIVPSAQQIIDVVARLVVRPGDEVVIEDPGYVGARAALAEHGAKLVPVPVDELGLVVSKLPSLPHRVKLVYVTPAHQEPLGTTMSVDRRLALLSWATAHGAFVLEDDYDGEFRYEGRPVPALQGLDRAGVVVHAGTFSKSMLPSLRLAYAVLPDALLEPFLATKTLLDRFTPVLMQAALADFIAGGHFERHLRRMRPLYAERRAALVRALDGEIAGAKAGIDLTLRLPPGVDDVALAAKLAAVGIDTLALSPSGILERASGLVLGFAAFSPARLVKVARVLVDIVSAEDGSG